MTRLVAICVMCIASPLWAQANNAADSVPGVQPALPSALTGRIVDGNGQPVADATVMISEDVVVTGADGNFTLRAPPGRYELSVMAAGYRDYSAMVRISARSTPLTVRLVATEEAAESIVVFGKLDQRSAATVVAERRMAANMTDGISAQELAKTPDSNAADAAKRMVSVAVLEGRYVALRGLEGRYVTTTLNGVVLPSTEPDKSAVPLDMFGSNLLASMVVHKSYSPELPSQFGGGTLALTSNSYPNKFEYKLGLSLGGSSMASPNWLVAPTATDGAAQWLGFAGGRELPRAVPRDAAVTNLSAEETTAAGRSFGNSWTTSDDGLPGSFGLSGNLGGTASVNQRPLGYYVSGSFRRSVSLKQGQAAKTALIDNELRQLDEMQYAAGEREVTIGAIGNASHQLTNTSSVSVLGLYTHVGEDTASESRGYSETEGRDLETTRLSYVGRELAFAHLRGQHKLADQLQVDWQSHVASTSQDELNTRDLMYTVSNTGSRQYKDQPGSGQRYFAGLRDTTVGAGLTTTGKFGQLSLKAGTEWQGSFRDFGGRRFRYRFIGDDASARSEDASTIFNDANIGTQFELDETTLAEDGYDASVRIMSGYISADADWKRIRGSLGARLERSTQLLTSGTPYAVSGPSIDMAASRSDFLPSVATTVVVRDDINVRAAYSYTLARPRVRELAPLLYFDNIRRRTVSGNPELATTRIHNGDLRVEWFAGDTELVAASAYYKRFDAPIEQVMINDQSDVAFRNAEYGTLVGGEVEARLSLGRWHKYLAPVAVGANVAVMTSAVHYDPQAVLILTTPTRPLYGQSPYLANVMVEYSRPWLGTLAMLYNVSGERVVDVGIQGIPDTYEAPLHRVDLTLSREMKHGLTLKMTGSNLLNQKQRLTQGEIEVGTTDTGVAFAVSMEWKPESK